MIEIDFDKSGKNCWKVFNKHTYKQLDGINCGPIACMKIMEIYGLIKPGTIEEIRTKLVTIILLCWIITAMQQKGLIAS